MKKLVISIGLLLISAFLFADVTKEQVNSAIRKFLSGDGKYICFINTDGETAYVSREYYPIVYINKNDRELWQISFAKSTEDIVNENCDLVENINWINSLSMDKSGNLYFRYK